MMDPLQSIDACVGITTCIVRICKYAVDFKDAGKVARETSKLVEDTQTVLEETKHSIDSQKLFDSESPISASRQRKITAVRRSIESCYATLEDLIVHVYGEVATDEKSLTLSKLQRAKISFNPNRIAGLKLSLSNDFNILGVALRALDIVDNTSLRDTLDHNFAEQDEKLRELGQKLDEVRSQLMSSPEWSRRTSVSSHTDDSAIGGLSEEQKHDHARDSRQNLNELLRDVEETHERLTFNNESDERDEPSESSERLELHRRVSYSPDLSKKLIDDYKAEAKREQADGRWKQAWKRTCKVIELSDESESNHNVPFTDVLEIHCMLVDILVYLHWWSEAFDRIEDLAHRFRKRDDNEEHDLRPEIAAIHYLQALVYSDRQQESADTAEEDMRSAYEDARQAFAIFNHESAPAHVQSDFFRELNRRCMELLASILTKIGEPIEANGISNFMEETFPSLLTNANVSQEADQDFEWRDEQGRTELLCRVINGDATKVSGLLQMCPADYVNVGDKNGRTALHHASKQGHIRIVEQLLDYGAKVNQQFTRSKETPLLFAVTEGHGQVVQALLRSGANPSEVCERSDGGTVLHMVHRHRNTDITSQLISKANSGAFVNGGNKFRRTALHECAEKGAVEQAQVLLRNGADVNAKTKSGKTALRLALDNPPSETMVNLLLDRAVESSVELDRSGLSSKAEGLLKEYESRRRMNRSSSAVAK